MSARQQRALFAATVVTAPCGVAAWAALWWLVFQL